MKVGIVQLEAQTGSSAIGHNRDQACQAAENLFGEGASLVVLPECAHYLYFPSSSEMLNELAEPLTGPSVQRWSELAATYRGYIVGGILEKDSDGIYNTAVLIGPRGLVGRYRKIHRFGWEREWLLAGNELPVFDLPGLGARIGLLICYDLRFSEAITQLALAGIDLLVVPTTWTSIGKRVLWDQHGYCPQNHLAIGHAYAHHIAVVCADRVGQEGDVTFLGSSIAVQPDGEVAIGPLDGHKTAAVITDLHIERSRDKRIGTAGNLLQDRGAESYKVTLISEY
jgi:predicted amidohydrolase